MDQNKKDSIEDVPFFKRPFTSGIGDQYVGENSDGFPTYMTTTGDFYSVPPQIQGERKSLKEVGQELKSVYHEFTDDPSGFVGNILNELVKGTVDFADRFKKGDLTYGEVMGSAPAIGTASLPFEVPEGAVRIFGGVGSKTAPLDKLPLTEDNKNFVKETVKKGSSPVVPNEYTTLSNPRGQWDETGWFQGPDDKFRYEIDDSKSKLDFTAVKEYFKKNQITPKEFIERPQTVALGSIFRHDELFTAYPELRDLKVNILPSLDEGNAYFDRSGKIIGISAKTFKDELDGNRTDLREVLLHELQHAVQNEEGFLRGSNVEDVKMSELGRKFSEEYWTFKGKLDRDYRDGVLSYDEYYSEDKKARKKYNSDVFDAYQAVYGEEEARAVEDRLNLSFKEKRETFPEDSGKLSRGYVSNIGKPSLNPYTFEDVRPEPLKFAEGGLVDNKENQMEFMFMADGGLTESKHSSSLDSNGGMVGSDTATDPSSGNEIPPGSTANEVSDKVPAKLSEGEYVLPADVVQFYGLDKIEKMVVKAKDSLKEMEANGRIGGDTESPEEDSLPFDEKELQTTEDTAQPMHMAEGGMVSTANTDRSMESRAYKDKDGNTKYIWFQNGEPIQAIPPGYVEATKSSGDTRHIPDQPNGVGGPVDSWSYDDFDSFLKGRPVFEKVAKISAAATGPAGLLMAAAAKLMNGRTTRRAAERIEEKLNDPDTPPAERAKWEEMKTKYTEAMGLTDSPDNTLLQDARGFFPRESKAAELGLYGKDKIPFNEGLFSWRQKQHERELEQAKNRETMQKVEEATKKEENMFASDNSNESDKAPVAPTDNEHSGSALAPMTSPRPERRPDRSSQNYSKGGLVKRRC